MGRAGVGVLIRMHDGSAARARGVPADLRAVVGTDEDLLHVGHRHGGEARPVEAERVGVDALEVEVIARAGAVLRLADGWAQAGRRFFCSFR